ncbi:MAG TPA: biopolymer transporter ExbD, partial [Bryobacteraceae bacterium]|nr:biopolymer transporter ExbD [Bryobacteraceae bacterium]
LIPLQLTLIFLIVFLTMSPLETSKGIRIRILRPGVSAQPSPGIQPLLVRVERRGREPARFYVNWQPVSTEQIDSLLREELGRRPPDWPVYVEGDGDMEWKDVLAVIDRLRGLNAEVVLLTRAP